MRRMRTKKALANYYKEIDKDTSVTEHFIYAAIRRGDVPCVMAGNKRLIAIEDFDRYLSGELSPEHEETKVGQIRRIKQ